MFLLKIIDDKKKSMIEKIIFKISLLRTKHNLKKRLINYNYYKNECLFTDE